jgi:hypothetical protein
MKEGTNIVDHLNILNTLMCQLTSMGVKIKDEDNETILSSSFLESWDDLFTSIIFSTTKTLDYDFVVGTFSSKEVRRKSNIESSTLEPMVARVLSKAKRVDFERYN